LNALSGDRFRPGVGGITSSLGYLATFGAVT
jgi:hypothetical protein